MSYLLGISADTLKTDNVDENREISLALAQQARRELLIFSQDLDAPLYDNQAFENAAFQLVRLHPSTRVRILLQDPTLALQQGHRLLRLSQNLTSSIFIRKPGADFQDELDAFIIVDGIGYLHRKLGSHGNYQANASFMAPLQARQLHDHFNTIWEQSCEDPQLRRLHI